MLELMRVDVERDARACMTELARRANGVDTCSDQVTRKRVPEIVEPELGQVIAVKARRFCCSVETALRNVIPVKAVYRWRWRRRRRPGVAAGSIARWRGGDHGDEARVDRRVRYLSGRPSS